MRFWSAVAVQLLAIALRDQKQRPWTISECPPVECECHCPTTPDNHQPTDPIWFILVTMCVLGGSSIGYLIGRGRRHDEAQSPSSRRRGGGILS